MFRVAVALAAALTLAAQDVHKIVTIATPARMQSAVLCGASGLAAGLGKDGSVRLFRLPSGEIAATRKAAEGPAVTSRGVRHTAIACSSDGAWYALGRGDGSVLIVDRAGNEKRQLSVASRRIDGLSLSPDNSILAVSVYEDPVQLWDPAKGTRIAALHTDFSGSAAMAFSPDSSRFATADADTTVRVYARNGELQAKYSEFTLEPLAISFTPDGKRVLTGGVDAALTLLDAASARAERSLRQHPDPVFGVIAVPDSLLAIAMHIDSDSLSKYSMVLWNLQTGNNRKLSLDGKALVGVGAAGGRVVLFTADSDASLTAWEFSASDRSR